MPDICTTHPVILYDYLIINSNAAFFKTNVTLRITALWAFSEAFMGGILHGLKIPFAGLVLAFVTSVCITLIALGNHSKGEIIKATLLVVAVKFILSPHTPPMAYVAVLIQGVAGELLFLQRKNIKPAAFILTVFSLLYSALQHLLILTIIFGKEFWLAMDIFLNKIAHIFVRDTVSYSLYILSFYIGCYVIAGIAGGIINISIINSVQSGYKTTALLHRLNYLPAPASNFLVGEGRPGRKKTLAFIFGSLMLVLLVFTYLPFFKSGFPASAIMVLITRAVVCTRVEVFYKSFAAHTNSEMGEQLQAKKRACFTTGIGLAAGNKSYSAAKLASLPQLNKLAPV